MKKLYIHTTETKSILSEETPWMLRRHFGFISDDAEEVIETGEKRGYYNHPMLLDEVIAILEDITATGHNFISTIIQIIWSIFLNRYV